MTPIFSWPAAGRVVFDPGSEGHAVREARVDFPNAVAFLRVDDRFVVAEPVTFTDEGMRNLYQGHVSRYAKFLRKSGLVVVTETCEQRSLRQRSIKRGEDSAFGELLLREFIVQKIEALNANGMRVLTTYVETCAPGDTDPIIAAASEALGRIPEELARDQIPLAKAVRMSGGSAFFRALRDFLAIANASGITLIAVPDTVSAALKTLKR